MQRINQILLIAAVVLFALSAFTYYESVTRAERFERGQAFLPNLNPDSIAEITVRQGEEETVLRRSSDGERFVIPSADGYRAKNSAVNRFVRDVLDLELEKEVGTSDDLAEELGLDESAEERIEVVFENDAGQPMVHFLVGDRFEDGAGHYVRRVDVDEKPIYLTTKAVYLQTASDDFVERQILDVAQDEIASIEGDGFVFARPEEGGELALVDLPEGRKASSKATQLKSALAGLRATAHHLANAPEVQGLVFDRRVDFVLDDGSGYTLESAEKDDTHYLRVQGFHTAGQVTIARDASEEEVAETADVLQSIESIDDFNAFHGSWVYEISESTANRLGVDASDLVEDA